jgi:hypothetical protein
LANLCYLDREAVWYAGDLEHGAQIIDRIGISAYFNRKISDVEMSQGEWHANDSHCFRGIHLLNELFPTEFDAIFSRTTRGQHTLLELVARKA